MQEHTAIPFPQPQRTAEDPLTAVLRQGAQRLLAQAIEAEVGILLAQYTDHRDSQGRQTVVRNGYLPEREVPTGIGAVRVKVPRVRDRSGTGIRFHSALLPPYIRRSKSLEALLPWLYLKGVSTGDFSAALQALVGPEAPGLSPTTISRLKPGWHEELTQWQGRHLTGKRYIYFWVDGVYFETRLEESRHCILVIMGWLPRERAVLERPPARPQKSRAGARASLGHWGWGVGFLESAAPGVRTDPLATVLGA